MRVSVLRFVAQLQRALKGEKARALSHPQGSGGTCLTSDVLLLEAQERSYQLWEMRRSPKIRFQLQVYGMGPVQLAQLFWTLVS